MSLERKLSTFGLEEQEVNLYIALLKRGGSSASILARDTNIKRTTTYALLSNLTRKGFAKVIYKKHIQWYIPVPPEDIAHKFEEKAASFQKLVPQLTSLFEDTQDIFGFRIIESVKELEEFYLEVLKRYKGQEYWIFANSNVWFNYNTDFFREFWEKRGKAKIKTKLLLTHDSTKINPTNPKEWLREIHYLPEHIYFKSTIDIYPDKILLISPKLSHLALVIESEAMIDVFKAMFQVLWESYVGKKLS